MRMDNFSAPFSTTINLTTTISNTSLSTSNVSLEQQNMSHVHFPDNTSRPLGLPTTPSHPPLTQFQFPPPPYISPYDPNTMMQFSHMQMFGHLMNSSYLIGQSEVMFGMKNIQPQGWSSHQPRDEEEDRGLKQAWSKMAREKRKQTRQKNKSSSQRTFSISEKTITRATRGHDSTSGESNVRVTVPQNKNPRVFYAPNGKRLDEILTKKLQNSDVSSLGRIVLPKRDAEEKLLALHDKEGINILLKDVYSDLWWSFKYKYWANNKSRMYVLENTGEFVNHYKLQMGDSVTLYEDELKTLYVAAEKMINPEVTELSSHTERLQAQSACNYSLMQTPDTVQAKEDEEDTYLAVLIKELEDKKEEAAANSLWTVCDDGCSSTGAGNLQMGQHSSSGYIDTTEGALYQASEQATVEAATSSSMDQTPVVDQQINFDDGFRGHRQ